MPTVEPKKVILLLILHVFCHFPATSQDPGNAGLQVSGNLLTDQRFLLQHGADWAWNENRLTLMLEKNIKGRSKFYSEIWLRNIGLPGIMESADLYNKGIVDPYNLDIRQAYVQLYGFLTKDLDLTIGRQRIAWGTADKLNPTDNLNPYDLEDILDFGRHRGSDALRLNYYLDNNFSMEGVFIPFFQPANMPIGIFANALNPGMDLPDNMVLLAYDDTVNMPRYNIGKSSSAGLKLTGFTKGIDLSLSYVYGIDGLPLNTGNIFYPVDNRGGVGLHSQLSFARMHYVGADLATSFGGVGIWAEGALNIPAGDIVMTNDLSAFFPNSPVPVTRDSLLLKSSSPYLKFIIGMDYFFSDGYYLNFQYLHGFIHERGGDNLNDYFLLRLEKDLFNAKLKLAPIGGGFIVSDWGELQHNYALIYYPEITYKATENSEVKLSAAIFAGEGDNAFVNLREYDMFLFKFRYSF